MRDLKHLGIVGAVLILAGCAPQVAPTPASGVTSTQSFTSFDLNGGGPVPATATGITAPR